MGNAFTLFLFDFLNLILIYKLARFKNTASLFYILAPSLFRGLLFVEDEILATFVLASIHFLGKKRYSLSTLMLALSFNHKFFPILLFPVLLLQMDIFKRTNIIPKIKNYRRLLEQISVFSLTTIFWPSFIFRIGTCSMTSGCSIIQLHLGHDLESGLYFPEIIIQYSSDWHSFYFIYSLTSRI